MLVLNHRIQMIKARIATCEFILLYVIESKYIRHGIILRSIILYLTVRDITSTSYFSVHFKTTTFWMMEGKFLYSGDSLGLADLSDKAN